MSEEQNILLPVWVYIQACAELIPGDGWNADSVEIKFRHTKVLAPDEPGAYTLGQRALPAAGWIAPRGVINDYVVPIYEQALTLEGSVQTVNRIVLPMRKETPSQESGSSTGPNPGNEEDGSPGNG